jgi:hypothetical protein
MTAEWIPRPEPEPQPEDSRAVIRSISDVPLVRDCGACEIEYIQESVLPKGAVVAITGDAGSGKSSLACAWARDANKQGIPVAILDRENPLRIVADRFQRLRMTDGPLLHYWGGWLPEEAPQPGSLIVMTWVASCTPRPLIIVDSLAAFHGGNENDAGEMRAFMRQCRTLADLGCTSLVIHHDGKAETAKDYRGSSDFKAAVDAAFHVSNFSDDGKLGKLVARCYKSRFGFSGEIVYQYADGAFMRDENLNAAVQTANEQLIALLRTNPGIATAAFEDLADKRHLGRNRARQFLIEGVVSGSIRREPGPRNIKHHFLTIEGSDGA